MLLVVLFLFTAIMLLFMITGLCIDAGRLDLYLGYYFCYYFCYELLSAHLFTLLVGEGDVILVFPLLSALYLDLDRYFFI